MAFNRLRDYLGQDTHRSECPCEQTDLNCVGEEGGCTYMHPTPNRPAPRIPRVRFVPERRVSPMLRFVFIVVACLLCAVAIVNLAAIHQKVTAEQPK